MNFLKTKHSTEFAVYLTDGYGYFPSETPKQSTLWVISPGGLPSPFRFCENARLKT